MRIDELKRIVKENGYKLMNDDLAIYIYGYSHGNSDEFKTEIRISKLRTKDITIETGIYCEEEEFNVIKASIEFAETPPEDREEEKKFYLKHRWIKGCVIMYLYRNELNGYCYLGDKKCRPHRQKRFTLKEIEEIKEKFDTDLADFELVEVEE